jgi:LysR family glycine cleavage system transcriptional activator
MGPTALVADDLAAGRLVAPFGAISLPTRNYHVYLTDGCIDDSAVSAFCNWLEEVGQRC